MTGSPKVNVVLPMSRVAVDTYPLSPRLSSLQSVTIGIVDNSKAGSDVLLRTIGDLLRAEYSVGDVVCVRKPSSAVPVSTALMHDLARCRAIICGVGD